MSEVFTEELMTQLELDGAILSGDFLDIITPTLLRVRESSRKFIVGEMAQTGSYIVEKPMWRDNVSVYAYKAQMLLPFEDLGIPKRELDYGDKAIAFLIDVHFDLRLHDRETLLQDDVFKNSLNRLSQLLVRELLEANKNGHNLKTAHYQEFLSNWFNQLKNNRWKRQKVNEFYRTKNLKKL